jgi:deoxyribose-phosphate aldolase
MRFASIPMLFVCLAWNQAAAAQVNEKFADMAPEIDMVRSMQQVERQSIVADAMVLTDQEAAAFWPVYKEYRAAIARVNDQLVKVITDYAAQRDTLTDAQAKKLLADNFAYEQDLVKTRKNYVSRFGKALPMIKVARFYQIDNKLDTITKLVMASQIPLAR